MAKTKKIILAPKPQSARGSPLSAYVDEALRGRVEKVAEDSGITISRATRLLIEAGLKYYETQQ